jgi:membrane associated rhomboid family serine protease
MIIPIGAEQPSLRRLPWVTLIILLANVVVFFTVGIRAQTEAVTSMKKLGELAEYWQERPYLDLPPEILEEVLAEDDREEVAAAIESVQDQIWAGSVPLRNAQQRELNALVEEYLAAQVSDPFQSWGLIPSRAEPLTALKSMFMHGGFWHLFGNMLWLWVTAPLLERAFGRFFFPVFYLLGGGFAALIYVGAHPSSNIPMVGASGAIAALMGAFAVRFSRVKIRFFYWVFVVFAGTFRIRAWIILIVWIGIQLAMLELVGEHSSVAYWAHIGGFGFGAALTYGLKLVRLEDRFRPHEKKALDDINQRSALELGRKELARKKPDAAKEQFEAVLARDPENPDAHLGLWQVYLQSDRPQDGATNLCRAIDGELKRGEYDLAYTHWRDLQTRVGEIGPAVLRWKLASSLQPINELAALELLTGLANDPRGGMLRTKATARLASLVQSEAERDYWNQRLAEEKRKPGARRPTETQPLARELQSPRLQRLEPESLQATVPPVPVGEATIPIETDAGFRVYNRALVGLGVKSLALVKKSEKQKLNYKLISSIVVAAIVAPQKPFLLIDLILTAEPGKPRRVVRLKSLSMNPQKLAGRPDLSAVEAFRQLVIQIAGSAGVQVKPPEAVSGQWPRFESLEAYEDVVLNPLIFQESLESRL